MVLDKNKSLSELSLKDRSREDEQLLVRGLPYVTAINDRTILLRDGDVMASFAVDGISASTADVNEIDELAAAFSALVSQQLPDVGFYVHRISTQTSPTLSSMQAQGSFASAVDDCWQDYISRAGLRHRTTLITLTIRPSKALGLWAKLFGKKGNLEEQIFKRATRLCSPSAPMEQIRLFA